MEAEIRSVCRQFALSKLPLIRNCIEEQQNIKENGTARPFIDACIGEWKEIARIERSISTMIGKGIDHLAKRLALICHGSDLPLKLRGPIPAQAHTYINDHLNKLQTKEHKANTKTVLAEIELRLDPADTTVEVYENNDVRFVTRGEGIEYNFEIKTPKPNYDQCIAMRRRLLNIYTIRRFQGVPADRVWAGVGFTYNPNGEGKNYSWPVIPYFLSEADYYVGQEFWSLVTGCRETMNILIDEMRQVMSPVRNQIADFMKPSNGQVATL